MLLYHYCTNASFISILTSNSLWLSDLSLSNDKMEGAWVKHVFSAICKEKKLYPSHEAHIDSCVDRAMSFLGWGGFCLSEAGDGDLLSQWRGYADNGYGISIGFSREYLEFLCKSLQEIEIPVTLCAVDYDTNSHRDRVSRHFEIIKAYIDKGAFDYSRFSLLQLGTPLSEEEQSRQFQSLNLSILSMMMDCKNIKNPAFREEKEWRLTTPFFNPKENSEIDKDEILFRPANDRIVPYRKIPLLSSNDVEIISKVIIGPRNITPDGVIENILRSYGHNNASVSRSAATYR